MVMLGNARYRLWSNVPPIWMRRFASVTNQGRQTDNLKVSDRRIYSNATFTVPADFSSNTTHPFNVDPEEHPNTVAELSKMGYTTKAESFREGFAGVKENSEEVEEAWQNSKEGVNDPRGHDGRYHAKEDIAVHATEQYTASNMEERPIPKHSPVHDDRNLFDKLVDPHCSREVNTLDIGLTWTF